ncbi:MAG: hypothetical protein KAQ68_11570 [Clostridiales bacterium]|nr:hypothetical protein [Clostridiales bacterium]
MLSFITTLAEVTLYSSIVIIGVLFIRGLFAKRLHILFLSLLWLIVLARLILPVTIKSPINLDNFLGSNNVSDQQSIAIIEDTQNSDLAVEDNIISDYTYSDEKTYFIDNINNQSAEVTNNDTQMQNPKPSFISIVKSVFKTINKSDMLLKIIITMWLCGAWITFLRNFFVIYDFSKKVKHSSEVKSARILKDLAKGKKILAISKVVKICECEFIDTPVTYGLLSPKILIPKNFHLTIDDSKMLLILLHELSHVKNHDILKNYIWLFARVIYWFNPLVTIAYRKYLEDIEYISDNAVIKNIDEQKLLDYTQSLLDSLKFSNNYTKVPCAISFCKSKSSLRKRVEIMLNPMKKSKLIGTMTTIICLILCIACFTTACIGKNDISAIAAEQPQNTEQSTANSNDTLSGTLAATPIPTQKEVKTIEVTPSQKSIKQSPIGNKESALALAKEIAERLEIPNDQGFQYINFLKDTIPPFHAIQLKDNPINNIQIYDFNGEIKYIQTNAYLSYGEKSTLAEDQLKENVVKFSNKVYPNTILNIKSIEILNREWKEHGTIVNNSRYVVSGDLFDKIDNTTRKFTSTITPSGEILTISADYNGLDYLNISSNRVVEILANANIEYTDLKLYQREEYYGEHNLHISLGKGIGTITLLESDLSLVDYLNIPNDTDAEYELTDDDINRLTEQYLNQFFPDNTDIVIKTNDQIRDDCIVEGTFTGTRGETDFYIQLNGDGKVHKIGISQKVDKASLEKIDKDTALISAIELILFECPFADEESLKLINTEDYKDEYIEAYAFKFEYTSLDPTIRDYSFTADVKVDIYSNKASIWRFDYIEDGLELMTIKEATNKAKEYIVAEFNVDPDKLIYKEFLVLTGYILEFQVNFDYDDGRSFGASMLADTGELDGIGWGD